MSKDEGSNSKDPTSSKRLRSSRVVDLGFYFQGSKKLLVRTCLLFNLIKFVYFGTGIKPRAWCMLRECSII
jgi:hypothetical protein